MSNGLLKVAVGALSAIMLTVSVFGAITSLIYGFQNNFQPLIMIAGLMVGASGFAWAKTELLCAIKRIRRD